MIKYMLIVQFKKKRSLSVVVLVSFHKGILKWIALYRSWRYLCHPCLSWFIIGTEMTSLHMGFRKIISSNVTLLLHTVIDGCNLFLRSLPRFKVAKQSQVLHYWIVIFPSQCMLSVSFFPSNSSCVTWHVTEQSLKVGLVSKIRPDW